MKGTGLYIRGLSKTKHGTPAEAAKKAKDYGLSHVAIMGAWQDVQRGKLTTVAANLRKDRWVPYAEAFKAAGVKVGLWFYPWAGGETQLLDLLSKAVDKLEVDYLLPDPEVGYKWKSGGNTLPVTMRGQGEAVDHVPATKQEYMRVCAAKLMNGLHEIRNNGEGPALGLTSYGMANYHPNFPWEEFVKGCDILSPQLYSVGPKQVDEGIASWANMRNTNGVWILPSIPMFGKNSGERLHHHLSAFVDGEEPIDGFIGWSWRQTSSAEWKTLERWAIWLERNLCAQ